MKRDETFRTKRNEVTITSIEKMIEWGIENKYDFIVLDGKFKAKHYEVLYDFILSKKIEILPYWFDISFEETVKRHATREKSKIFDAEEMGKWWVPHDLMPNIKEKLIVEKMAKDEILAMILKDLGL